MTPQQPDVLAHLHLTRLIALNPRLRSTLTSGHHDEALAVAERGRTRAFADLLVERQTGQQDSDPYTPVTVEHILDTVNSQRALVLYFSMAAGYLYSWLLAPGAGEGRPRLTPLTPAWAPGVARR